MCVFFCECVCVWVGVHVCLCECVWLGEHVFMDMHGTLLCVRAYMFAFWKWDVATIFSFFFFFYSVIVIWNSSRYSRIKAKYCHTRGTRGKSQISKPGSSEGPGHTEPNRLQITAGRIGGLR